MRTDSVKYFVLLFALLAGLCSCFKELPADPQTTTVHYAATVQGGVQTRATISGAIDNGGVYLFEAGDQLYVSYKDGEDVLKVHGVLNLTSGEGSGTGVFEGDLTVASGFDTADANPLCATLVSATDEIHTISGDVITDTVYPPAGTPIANTSTQDLVRKYSDFTDNTHAYNDHLFTLTQQSVILLFSIEVNRTKLTNARSAPVSIKKGETTLRTISSVPVNGLTAVGKLEFASVFPAGTDLAGAEVWVESLHCKPDFASNLSLAANTYYHVKRSSLLEDWFRIKAISNGTTVTFNYTGNGIKYSTDGGANWTDYNAVTGLPLDAGQEICWQGARTNYKNAQAEGGSTYGAPAGTPIFTADKKCYIAGNVMTLLADKENLVDYAFDGAFSKQGVDNTWTDIDPADPLLLPATTLTLRCYKGMFRRCTALQYAPDLPAETGATECYNGMFRQCGYTNLKRVAIYLKAKTGDGNNPADFDFTNMGDASKGYGYLDKWMHETNPPASGTYNFYCHPDMLAYWVNVWDWYGQNNQFANRPKNWTGKITTWTDYIDPPTPTP